MGVICRYLRMDFKLNFFHGFLDLRPANLLFVEGINNNLPIQECCCQVVLETEFGFQACLGTGIIKKMLMGYPNFDAFHFFIGDIVLHHDLEEGVQWSMIQVATGVSFDSHTRRKDMEWLSQVGGGFFCSILFPDESIAKPAAIFYDLSAGSKALPGKQSRDQAVSGGVAGMEEAWSWFPHCTPVPLPQSQQFPGPSGFAPRSDLTSWRQRQLPPDCRR